MGDGKKFVLLSDKNGDGLPLVAWRLAKEEHYDGAPGPFLSFPPGIGVEYVTNTRARPTTEFAIARQLRSRGWIVPAYTVESHILVLRYKRTEGLT